MTDTLQWHRDALAGKKPPIHEIEPQCGFFLAKLEGKLIPGRIFYYGERDEDGELNEDEYMRATIGGVEVDLHEGWVLMAKRPITEAEFNARTEDMHYANMEHF